jgi:hypothetical protein
MAFLFLLPGPITDDWFFRFYPVSDEKFVGFRRFFSHFVATNDGTTAGGTPTQVFLRFCRWLAREGPFFLKVNWVTAWSFVGSYLSHLPPCCLGLAC